MAAAAAVGVRGTGSTAAAVDAVTVPDSSTSMTDSPESLSTSIKSLVVGVGVIGDASWDHWWIVLAVLQTPSCVVVDWCAVDADFSRDLGDDGAWGVDPVTGDLIDIAFGSGPCPVDQIGELISPIIDISGADVSSVSLSFYQDARQFASNYLVGYSLDGGSTWTDIPVNTEVEGNARIDDGEIFQSIPLPGLPIKVFALFKRPNFN